MAVNDNREAVIALGFFDGVHRGHGKLIEMAKKRAEERSAIPAVLSFDVSPESVIKGKNVPLISSTEAREDAIHRFYDVEKVIFYHFDKRVMSMPWKEFIDSLIAEFNAVHFVIGHDFNCGYMGQGTTDRITEYCKSLGIGCDVIPKFTIDDITVSSTYIRSLISVGDIERANMFLGHPYTIVGEVSQGFKMGRKIGAPTINIHCKPELLLPPFGVYATKVLVGDEVYIGVTNVGVRPTFGGDKTVSVETYILDFEGDLYGKNVRVDFYTFLRPERKFESPEELKNMIDYNAKQTREYFGV